MSKIPHNPKDKKSMHPEDRRNLVIFFFVVVGLFLLYDMFIHKPHLETLRLQQQIAAEQAARPAPSSAQIAAAEEKRRLLDLDEALELSQRVPIRSATVTGSLSLKGGRIDDLVLNEYFKTTARIDPISILAPSRTAYPQYADFGWISETGASVKTPNAQTEWTLADSVDGQASQSVTLTPDTPIILQWDNGEGLTFRRHIALDERYAFEIKDVVVNNTGSDITLFPYAMISRVGLPEMMNSSPIIHEGPIAYLNDELHEPDFKGLDKGEDKVNLNASTGWIGITEKYWFTALLPQQTETARYNIDAALGGQKPRYHVDYTSAGVNIAAGETGSHSIHFFAGPKIVRMLEDYSTELNIPHFDLAVDFGIFYFMTRPFFTIVTWIGHTTGSFAMAILIFTVILRLAVFPLANKSFRSFARMRKITPQMIELREKYGKDREKLQKEIFALYQKEKVNPMAGCLPILIQIPIFFSLYKVLYMSIEMRHTPFWGWIEDMSAMDPTNIFTLFGLIPWDAPSFLVIGAWPCIMGLTLILQQKLNPPPQDPIQQKMMMFMPFMITFILAKFPAGLVIYWSWSNLLSMGQQYILMRKEGVDVNLFKRSKAEEKLGDLVENGPAGVSPSAEMIEEEVEDILDGTDGENAQPAKKKKKAAAKATTTKNPAAKKKAPTKKKAAPTTKKAPVKKAVTKPAAKTDAKVTAKKAAPKKTTAKKKDTNPPKPKG